MGRTRTALFVDFDNVFSGLLSLDPQAALAFAQDPAEWLGRLANASDGDARAYLVMRCYMNPAGWRLDPVGGQDRLYFSKFRPYFTRAGFEVIDCPSLTARHKNAADIRICLDVLDSLARDTRYDEYIVASGDSDFTPLLLRLRACDRRIVVMATSQAAIAYKGIADEFLDEDRVIGLVRGEAVHDEVDDDPRVELSVDVDGRENHDEDTEHGLGVSAHEQFRSLIDRSLATSDRALNLAALGIVVRSALGVVIDQTNWFGAGGLARAIMQLGLPDVRTSTYYVWVVGRHDEPAATTHELMNGEFARTHAEVVVRLCKVSDVPRLETVEWDRAFSLLADYARENDFSLTEVTRSVRDRLASEGHEVGRGAIGLIVRGALHGGAPLTNDPPPTAPEIAAAFLSHAVSRAAAVEMVLGHDELRTLRDWIYPGLADDSLVPLE